MGRGPTEAALAPPREVRQGSGGAAPSGVQGRSPGGGLGGRSPPENFEQNQHNLVFREATGCKNTAIKTTSEQVMLSRCIHVKFILEQQCIGYNIVIPQIETCRIFGVHLLSLYRILLIFVFFPFNFEQRHPIHFRYW